MACCGLKGPKRSLALLAPISHLTRHSRSIYVTAARHWPSLPPLHPHLGRAAAKGCDKPRAPRRKGMHQHTYQHLTWKFMFVKKRVIDRLAAWLDAQHGRD